jgi:hypothetical protein
MKNMTTEKLAVVLKNGKHDIWFYPFRWYKYPWGRSYEPYRKDKQILDELKEWHKIDEEVQA